MVSAVNPDANRNGNLFDDDDIDRGKQVLFI